MSSSIEWVVVGRLGRPHGLGGELTLTPLSDYEHRFDPGAVLYTGADRSHRLLIERTRRHHDKLLIKFAGIGDRTSAESMRGLELHIPESELRELEAGEFWPRDLEGLAVRDLEGRRLGVVTGVEFGRAQDRLVVTTGEGSVITVPFVDDIVAEVDPSGGYVVVTPPEGLF